MNDEILKNPVNEILIKLMKASSLEEIEEIINEITDFYENKVILTSDAILLTKALLELKNNLGFLERRKVPSDYKASLKEIRDLLNGLTLVKKPLNEIASNYRLYGLFGIDNRFILAGYLNCPTAYLKGNENLYVLGRRAIVDMCTKKLLDGSYPVNKNYLKGYVQKIIDIMGVQTYVVSGLELLGERVYYTPETIELITEEINKFLNENPYFIQDLFNRAQRKLTM